jgi:O-antigen/teichoic acid export membrane protein
MALLKIRPELLILACTTLVSAVLGFVQSVLVTQTLGVEWFGVVGIVTSVCVIVLCFFDFRVYDVASKVYLAQTKENNPSSVAVLHAGAFVQLALALLSFVVAVLLSAAALPLLTKTKITTFQIIAISGFNSINYFFGYFSYLHRLSGRPTAMALWQLLSNCAGVCILSLLILDTASIDRYASAILLSSAIAGVINFWAYLKLFRVTNFASTSWRVLLAAIRLIAAERRVLLHGNLIGYIKILSRAGDVLLVGAVCNDFHTGLYRFSRSLTDNLSLIYEVAVKFYQPLFLKASTEGDATGFRQLARTTAQAAMVIGSSILLGEFLFLAAFLAFFYDAQFSESWLMVLVLSVPVAFSIGVHLWLWPLLVGVGRLGFFTTVSFVTNIVVQYLLPTTAQILLGREDAILFAFGYSLSFVLTYVISLWWVKTKLPNYSPI